MPRRGALQRLAAVAQLVSACRCGGAGGSQLLPDAAGLCKRGLHWRGTQGEGRSTKRVGSWRVAHAGLAWHKSSAQTLCGP